MAASHDLAPTLSKKGKTALEIIPVTVDGEVREDQALALQYEPIGRAAKPRAPRLVAAE